MPTRVFHVTSAANRASIARFGLDWRRMAGTAGVAGSEVPEGARVFLARDLWEVEWFKRMAATRHSALDVWEVMLPWEFDVDGDVPPGIPCGESDGYLYVREAVPPERVRLMQPDELA